MDKAQLFESIRKKKSFLCVGLDVDLNKVPRHLLSAEDPVFEFNKAIIDATADYCIAYKPNLAFYESLGFNGLIAFEKTVRYIRSTYPDQFIIADAKRGDIGNTAKMYARSFFEHYEVDAITVAPYMGRDSVEPFTDYPGKWTIVLALTSNAGSKDFQMITDKRGCRLFEDVLLESHKWNNSERLMYVAGATRGELLADVRRLVPQSFLLVPGVGSQGGSLQEVCKYAMTDFCGLIVNSSRSILYASSGEDFDVAASVEARVLAEQMASELKSREII